MEADPGLRFAEGLGAAAAASGLLSPLQGRIFGWLYLQPEPRSLDAIAAALGQSKSHVSVQIRGLVDAQLVRRGRVAGSRRDHYEATTDFWRALCELLERRFRAHARQVLAALDEVAGSGGAGSGRRRGREARFVAERLAGLRRFFAALDAGLAGFASGRSFAPGALKGPSARYRAARPRR